MPSHKVDFIHWFYDNFFFAIGDVHHCAPILECQKNRLSLCTMYMRTNTKKNE